MEHTYLLFPQVLTSTAHARMNFLAASFQMAGTVKTHLISLSSISDICRLLTVSWKWSFNALIKRVKSLPAGYSLPFTSCIFNSLNMPLKENYN